MPTAYLNFGTNIGDRLSNLERAVAIVERLCQTPLILSSIIESQPWGYSSPNSYLNIGAALQWHGTPHQLLAITQQAERQMHSAVHRDALGNYIDRIIDIDIIEIEGVTLTTPNLTIPHPRRLERDFVMKPLLQLKKQLNRS